MKEDKGVILLSESEYKLLANLKGKVKVGESYTTDTIANITGLSKSSVEAVIRLLADKGIVNIREEEKETIEITPEARKYIREGFPEEKLVEILLERGGEEHIDVIKGILKDAEIALSNAIRKNWIEVRNNIVRLKELKKKKAEERSLIKALLEGKNIPYEKMRILRRRKLIKIVRKKETLVEFPYEIGEILGKARIVVGALTRDLIASGYWRRVELRPYDITASPPKRYPGRLHFMREFIEYVRDIMKELGFIEVDGSPVETEFWNYDVLFQPQFHPAREPTDTFYLASPSRGNLPDKLAEKVAELHKGGYLSKGWGYEWSPEKASNLILRSHTTAVSVRILSRKPKPPFRFFTIGKVYRVETIDASHLLEFHQLDGIASENDIGFSDLLGIISEFFERLGIKEYKFRPAYFPFTEPSAEASIRLRGKWLEVLGCGMFRPEVLEAVGVDYPVAAWGMGLERIAMAVYDINDIRMLYTDDVSVLRSIPSRWWIYAGTLLQI